MNLARHSISSTAPVLIFDTRFDPDTQLFTTCTQEGFAIYRVRPLQLLRKREISGGTLAAAVPLHSSSLLFLLGGGRSPRYPPNKVIFWDEAKGKEVADLEFRERVRGLACRRGWLAVALKRRVVVYKIDKTISRFNEYATYENPRGLLALATAAYSTLLAVPGRQMGHVQLIHLPPCSPPTALGPPPPTAPLRPPPPPTHNPISIIVAHENPLTTLSVPPSGRLLATTSSRGTLVRVWDAFTGKIVRELRRGADQAEIYGVAFRPDEKEVCVWSDKGTIHVFGLGTGGGQNRQSSMSGLASFLPILPKYFGSEWSYALYRIPTQTAHISLTAGPAKSPTADDVDEEKCIVGWIQGPVDEEDGPQEYQLLALTYTGGWYRLSLPGATTVPSTSNTPGRPATPLSTSPPRATSVKGHTEFRPRSGSVSSYSSRTDKGKEKEGKECRECTLKEYRKYGRWDGWG